MELSKEQRAELAAKAIVPLSNIHSPEAEAIGLLCTLCHSRVDSGMKHATTCPLSEP